MVVQGTYTVQVRVLVWVTTEVIVDPVWYGGGTMVVLVGGLE